MIEDNPKTWTLEKDSYFQALELNFLLPLEVDKITALRKRYSVDKIFLQLAKEAVEDARPIRAYELLSQIQTVKVLEVARKLFARDDFLDKHIESLLDQLQKPHSSTPTVAVAVQRTSFAPESSPVIATPASGSGSGSGSASLSSSRENQVEPTDSNLPSKLGVLSLPPSNPGKKKGEKIDRILSSFSRPPFKL